MQKKNILFLRGWGREAGHWCDFPLKLKKSINHIDYYFIDIPSAGKFNHLKSPTNISDIVTFLKDEFEKIKKGKIGDWIIVSISFGGMIAMDWANKYPEDFKKVFLINSSFNDLSPFYKRLKLKRLPDLMSIMLEKDVYKRELKIISMLTNHHERTLKYAKDWSEVAALRPVTTANMLRQLLAAFKYQSPEKIKGDIIVINGQKDRLVDSECSKKIAEKYQAKLYLDEESGHDIPLDNPGWLIDIISENIQ